MSAFMPSSWVECEFSELVEYITSGSRDWKKYYSDTGANFIRTQDINTDSLDLTRVAKVKLPEKAEGKRTLVHKGDLLITITGANVGKCAYVSTKIEESYVSQSVALVRPVDKSLSKFLQLLLVSSDGEKTKLQSKAYGMGRPVLNLSNIRELRIGLPSFAEQKQIVAKLDELLAQVDTLKTRLDTIPSILKRFCQSVLAAAVSGKLTEDWRKTNKTKDIEKFVELINSKKEGRLKVRVKKGWDEELNLFNLPEKWAWVLNHKLAEDSRTAICAGPFGTIFKAKDFRDEGVPIIFLRHVKEDGFNQKKPKCMDLKVWKEFHQEYSVYGGELLVAKLGEPPGESCIYPKNTGVSMVTPDVLKMNVDSRVVDINYLLYFFNSPISKQMIGELAFGATRLRIDIAMFKCFPIPMPPREEQTQIVNQVEKLFTFADQIEQRVKEAQKRVNNLTQSILDKAFRGELTADWREQNPGLISGENSAEALLERIQTERVSTA